MASIDINNVVDLYIRVSTSEQAEEGYSVAEQEERLRSYCAAYNYTINAVHVDPGFSGASLDRPAIKKVMYDVEHGRCKKVIVWKLDRLSRSQKDTLILLEDVFLANDCNFISLMESFDTSTPFGRCIVGILAAFAQMERENIKIRTMMGRQAGSERDISTDPGVLLDISSSMLPMVRCYRTILSWILTLPNWCRKYTVCPSAVPVLVPLLHIWHLPTVAVCMTGRAIRQYDAF